MTAAENEPQDLYHRILKAQKEYKELKEQQRQQQTSTTDNRASSSAEMNPMELILCVFFWNLYQDYDLEVSVLDSIPQKDLAMEYSLKLTELKVNVVEKKNLELNGQASLLVRMDEHNLRPAWANAALEYNCKMQNMRLVVSLVSMFFINDLTQFIRTIVFTVNNLVRTSAVNTVLSKKEIRRELSWATSVLNKLYDYERCCPAHRQEVLHINIIGNWALKMATFESMITDLFISMTLLKVCFNQKHTRIHSSCQAVKTMRTSTLLQQPSCSTRSHTTATAPPPPFSTQTSRQDRSQPTVSGKNVQPPSTPSLVNEEEIDNKAENSAATTTSLTLDWMNVCLKRASLIVSEHIVNQQRNSDTRQYSTVV
uniref:Uncharacterized protein n=1 Tax=Ditylenchus dipsaci TaxID=166011 RepID=A0A915E7M6_9BILA